MGWLIGLLVFAVLLVAWLASIYNNLVNLRNRFRNAFAQIDVQLKRRHDLIPNLVETAKGFLAHERETLEAVIAARNSAEGARQSAAADPGDPQAMKRLVNAEAGLSGMLGRFFALSEAYPDLKSNQNMMQLSEELSTTENKIAFARQAYNDAVMRYNDKCEMVPSNIIAGMFGFQKAEFFEVETESERAPVKVQF
ncbi:MAG TPA: LemA family protein [Polyangiales bacterium]|jgi:LemA protein|nr:LemA family protein [Polyangiales bacterium]